MGLRKFTVVRVDPAGTPSVLWVEAESYKAAAEKNSGPPVACVFEGLHHMWLPVDVDDPTSEPAPDEMPFEGREDRSQ